MKDFEFGEPIVNAFASDDNPHKRGIFVRKFKRRGRLNSGTFIEMTDGKGEFWTVDADAVVGVIHGSS